MSTFRLALLAAALAYAQAASAQATLTGSATAGTTPLNGTGAITVDMILSDPIVLGGASLNLTWDPAKLDFQGVDATVFGQSLADFVAQFDPTYTTYDISPGHYGVSLLATPTPGNLPAGPVSMSFSFIGLALGTQGVHIDLSLTDGDFNNIPLALDSSVIVMAVPEAPPAAMLAAGMGVLALIARRRRV